MYEELLEITTVVVVTSLVTTYSEIVIGQGSPNFPLIDTFLVYLSYHRPHVNSM